MCRKIIPIVAVAFLLVTMVCPVWGHDGRKYIPIDSPSSDEHPWGGDNNGIESPDGPIDNPLRITIPGSNNILVFVTDFLWTNVKSTSSRLLFLERKNDGGPVVKRNITLKIVFDEERAR